MKLKQGRFRQRGWWLVWSWVLCLSLIANVAGAQTLESLQQAGKLSIQTRIVPHNNIIALQQLELQIEVATDKWFSGGTRIGGFEVKDAIVLQREKFAVNATRAESGVTWTVQTWSLTIYPQRAGGFEVPGIELTLSIAGDDMQKIEGRISTGPLSFSVEVPPQLQNKDSWVTSPAFSVKESFDQPLEGFNPGDALVRTIKFFAEDTPAMMLPDIKAADIQGVGVYHKPPVLSDKVNRGDYFSERTEMLTYVFELPGEYVLPEERFYWWNLSKQSLQEIILPEHRLQVGPVVSEPDKTGMNTDVDELANETGGYKRTTIALLLGLLLISLSMFWFARKRGKGDRKPKKPVSERALQKAFRGACRRHDTQTAVALMYQYLDHFAGDQFTGEIRPLLNIVYTEQQEKAFNAVMRAAFTDNAQQQSDICEFARQFFHHLEKSQQAGRHWPTPIELKLN